MASADSRLAGNSHTAALASVEVTDVKDDLVDHIMACPMKARMDALEDFVTSQKTKQSDDDRWISKLMPLLYAAGGIGFYLLMAHASDVMKFIQR